MGESIYSYAGGAEAFRRLAAAHHERCLADDLLEHPFSHGVKPDHVERLAAYWGEVFGGPPTFTESYGGHTAMITPHAGCDAEPAMGSRFVECFVAAADDAGLRDEPEFRAALRDYMTWATAEVMSYTPRGSIVEAGLAVPHWSWDGLETGSGPV